MPRRVNRPPQPSYCFLPSGKPSPELFVVKGRGSVARRHAAYWSGPGRYNKDRPTVEVSHSWICAGGAPMGRTTCASPLALGGSMTSTELHDLSLFLNVVQDTEARRDCLNSQDTMTIHNDLALSGMWNASFCDLAEAVTSHPETGFGGQVRQRLTEVTHSSRIAIASSCALVTTAQSIAIAGKGSRFELLRLKDAALRAVSTQLSHGINSLKPACVAAVALLSTPVACLLTQDLPFGLDIEVYARIVAESAQTCCSKTSVLAATQATDERLLHWRRLQVMLTRSSFEDHDPSEINHMRFAYRYAAISVQFEANEVIDDSFSSFVPTERVQDKAYSSSREWTSPLSHRFFGTVDDGSDLDVPAVGLSRLVRHWLSTFLDEHDRAATQLSTVLQHRQVLRWQIESFVLVHSGITTPQSAQYACCWWAATVFLRADQLRISLGEAARQIQLRPRLNKCLRMTELADLWGNHRGLLFWVVSVCHLVTADRCFRMLTTALYARFAHVMALDISAYHIGMSQLRRLRAFEELCIT